MQYDNRTVQVCLKSFLDGTHMHFDPLTKLVQPSPFTYARVGISVVPLWRSFNTNPKKNEKERKLKHIIH